MENEQVLSLVRIQDWEQIGILSNIFKNSIMQKITKC